MESTLTTSELYYICNKYKFFTCGSCEQYDKFFNYAKTNPSIHDLAVILYICSNDNLQLCTIETVLTAEQETKNKEQ